MSTQSQSLVTVVVDGRPLGVFDTRTGGESSGEITKYRPGGQARQKSYGGRAETGDVTVTRVNERERDNDLVKWLRTRVVVGEMSINEQPLDDNDQPWGKPTTWTGRLQSVNGGDTDSNSNDVRPLELVCSATEVV